MKVLITGAGGMLGTDLQAAFADTSCIALTRNELDITQELAVREAVLAHHPDVILNAAAYTNVDRCETEIDQAYAVNAVGARNVAVAAEQVGARLVHVSTDYVFPGVSDRPYREEDETGPIGEYGRSKLAGERLVRSLCKKHYIARTSWLYGKHGPNFVKTMLRMGREQGAARVVDDQVGSPTYTVDLAQAIRTLIETPQYGVYHLSNQGVCSWHAFAEDIFTLAGVDVNLQAIKTHEFPRPAKRPAYSVMDNMMWRLSDHAPLRHYREALVAYLQETDEIQGGDHTS
ncbi:dTDP-4-dehydrorhamnose reductase [Ferroacidibacillus organovorans]|uniref:dTDP-4-dehydrorhamnose reductase n=1 Tax=Ferroacidibacillus organovorans TaxID=1765683 RepID=A0A1V4ER95_9BACL|nr:dTDP-4-dehydrorhamnose reductase [Ferroacidibacillus organovorans]OPG15449.1 dTDP-4-dehydrorhamnose reductase [Ferroacidibacillus organovorans]